MLSGGEVGKYSPLLSLAQRVVATSALRSSAGVGGRLVYFRKMKLHRKVKMVNGNVGARTVAAL